MLLSMAVLFTVGTISMSLISCDDDDNASFVSFFHAWDLTNMNESLAAEYSEVVWDFVRGNIMLCYGKRLSDDQWEVYYNESMTVYQKNAASGTFVLMDDEDYTYSYSIKGLSLTIKESDGTVWKLKLRET